MIHPNDRKITVVDRGSDVLVIDARNGSRQLRYRSAKGEATKVMFAGPADMIVVDVASMTHTVEALPVRVRPMRPERPARTDRRQPSRKLETCKHFGELLRDESFPPAAGLGDMVANGLSAIGVTKERWSALVSQGRSEGVCTGCDGRQIFVNWLGEKLGLSVGQGPILHKLLEADEIKPQPVFACVVHGKCLPTLRRDGEVKQAIEGAGFHLCYGCKDKELVPIESPDNLRGKS